MSRTIRAGIRRSWIGVMTLLAVGAGGPFGFALNINVGDLGVELERVYQSPNQNTLPVPIDLVIPDDGTNRMIVIEKRGRISLIKNGVASTFLDLESITLDSNANGLLGLALHPDHSNPAASGHRKFYTYRTVDHDNGATFDFVEPGTPVFDILLTEWEVDASNPDIANPTSGRDLFRAVHTGTNLHPGGKLDFGPDGYLYISIGVSPPSSVHAQELDKIQGKILKIDPLDPADTPGSSDPPSTNNKYRIPASNPFVSTANAFDEIYAIGFRHPFRMSVDHETGLVFVGDVGQGLREEVAVVQAGENHGWPYREGSVAGIVATPVPAPTMVEPIADYSHTDGVSVMGGYVYHGSAIPELQGKYIFGEYRLPSDLRGRLFWLDPYDENGDLLDYSEVTIQEFAFGGDTCALFAEAGGCDFDIEMYGFSQDTDGEIYVLGREGNPTRYYIYKFTDAFPVGDYNRDGVVDDDDFEVWKDTYGSTTVGMLDADGNGDGRVNGADFTIWRDHIGNSWDSLFNDAGSGAGQALAGIPEPSGLALATLGSLLFAILSRGRLPKWHQRG